MSRPRASNRPASRTGDPATARRQRAKRWLAFLPGPVPAPGGRRGALDQSAVPGRRGPHGSDLHARSTPSSSRGARSTRDSATGKRAWPRPTIFHCFPGACHGPDLRREPGQNPQQSHHVKARLAGFKNGPLLCRPVCACTCWKCPVGMASAARESQAKPRPSAAPNCPHWQPGR